MSKKRVLWNQLKVYKPSFITYYVCKWKEMLAFLASSLLISKLGFQFIFVNYLIQDGQLCGFMRLHRKSTSPRAQHLRW